MIYILKCPSCGNTEFENLEMKDMFWCNCCGEELHKNELEIEEVKVQIKITD